MYRFALRPRWILSHIVVALVVVAFVNLGLWQLRRLDEKRAENELIRSRSELPPTDVSELATVEDPVEVGAGLDFRSATATGAYLSESVLVRSRSMDGRPGFWVLTPLDLGSGEGIIVNRGWVPFRERTDGSDVAFGTPGSRVTVSGIVRESVGGADPAGEDRATVDHVDVDWLDEQSELDLYPFFVQLEAQDPPPEGLPTILDPPAPGEGPHLGYAVQWFTFALIALCGYPLILRRVAGEQAALSARPDPTTTELIDA